MDRSIIPYCGPGAVPGALWTDWNLDVVLLCSLGALALAWVACRRVTPAGRGAGRRADIAFAGGWAILFVAFVSPLCALSAALFAARIVHHMLLVAVAAPLFAMAFRRVLGDRLRAPLPLVPLACLHVVLFWFWHAPSPYAAAMADDALYWLMETSLLVSAFLFWAAALDRRAPLAVVLPTVIGVMAQMGFLAALLAFAGQALYDPHAMTTLAWGLTPREDQQLAGLIMWVPGALPYLVLLVRRVAAALETREDAQRSG